LYLLFTLQILKY